MLKKWLWGLLLSILIFWGRALPTFAQQNPTNLYLFYGEGCPHCAKEKEFLADFLKNHPSVQLQQFEIYYNKKNNQLLQEVAEKLNAKSGGVPFLIIGDTPVIGFSPGYTDDEISQRVRACVEQGCSDSIAALVQEASTNQLPTPWTTKAPQPAANDIQSPQKDSVVELPLLGKVNVSTLSLPVLTIILAGLDGFNPCAMWTLLFLISLLLGMKDRRRMWALGIAFIVASAAVYFLFLSAWLNLFLFLGLVVWIRAIIGVVSLAAGGYNIRDYWINKDGGCKVMGNQKRRKVMTQLKEIAQKQQFFIALGGIILLAVAVNMVELICSAGLPAIYTQVLTLSNLPTWQYYLYLLFYIFIFMLDDLIIFFTAMITLKAVGIESKYSRYSHLIGGILMLIIGLLLLFKPEWLMFG